MAGSNENPRSAAQKRYPPELKERAVRMVLETIEQTGERQGVITRIARQLGVGTETLRYWVKQAEIDQRLPAGGADPGPAPDRRARAGEPGAAPGERDTRKRHRLSSAGSSTRDCRSSRFHRRSP